MIGEMQRCQPAATDTSGDSFSYDGWALGGCATLFTLSTDPGHSNPGGMNNQFFESPGSQHSQGANFGMGDGSVLFFSQDIDSQSAGNNSLFCLLGSMADGQQATVPSD
jgi:prepilin-type processing-associated H-X9-DG protein